jgi:phytoene synthase
MPIAERAEKYFVEADRIMSRYPRKMVRAPRIMSRYYHIILERLLARGFEPPRKSVKLNKLTKMLIFFRYAII